MSTKQVIDWFRETRNKHELFFVKFDIISFYPSITERLYTEAIEYAKQYSQISDEEMNIFWHTRKQLVTWCGNVWTKTNSDLDVSTGSFDGAEACELIGLFALHRIGQELPHESIGLYRDDGLGVTKKRGPQASALEKTLHRIFHRLGLRITLQVNIRKTDFLGIILDLETGRTAPYKKQLETPIYVSKESSHPASIIKRIPETVSSRLSAISSSEEEFNRSKQPYQEALQKALQKAGYAEKLEYKVPAIPTGRRKNRKRKAIWWNPPYCMTVQTNLTKIFIAS